MNIPKTVNLIRRYQEGFRKLNQGNPMLMENLLYNRENKVQCKDGGKRFHGGALKKDFEL